MSLALNNAKTAFGGGIDSAKVFNGFLKMWGPS